MATFLADLEPEVLTLERELRGGRYQPRPLVSFRIRDPKPRTISVAAFRDRVVHHALCAALEPRFERYADFDSYARRVGKGNLAAVQRLRALTRRHAWTVKLDVRHYFEAVDHGVLLGMLDHLSVRPSYSRPRVSDDNPFSEALFRTVKYRPEYPTKPFDSIEAAQAWVEHFVDWYNHEHKHSAIGLVTPHQRHTGQGLALLERRRKVYEAARQAHPERWTGPTRSWSRPDEVALNPSDQTRERMAS